MTAPRIQLIHAVPAAIGPVHDAFARLWPEAGIVDLSEFSLASDLERAGALDDSFTARMTALVGYGVQCGADAVLFTCSAFGAAIDDARKGVSQPVLKPDEAMIAAALDRGPRIGALATFEPTLASLKREISGAAKAAGLSPTVTLRHVPDALAALNGGRPDDHHRLVADAAAQLTATTDIDVLLLAQFSMVGARAAAEAAAGVPVLTAPDEAVKKLKGVLGG